MDRLVQIGQSDKIILMDSYVTGCDRAQSPSPTRTALDQQFTKLLG